MASLKKLIVAIGLIVFFAQSSLAGTKPASFQSVLERLLDNQQVINVVDDFLVFWDQAKDKPLNIQRRLWRRLVENKHRDYFDRAVYRTTDPIVRRAMLDDFLIRVPSQVESIREFNRSLSDVPTSPLLEAFIYFKTRFGDYHQQASLYIGLSMFRFDGAVRPVENDEGIPDTLCLGAEVLSGYSREQVRTAIVHEFFHLYHFGFLFENEDEISPAEFRAAYIPLMIEGMAAAGTEEIFPNESRELILHFAKDELASQERDLSQNAKQYLDLIREGAPPEQYGQWFTHTHLGDAPPRGGYLLGYEVARRVMSSYGLEQMIRMTPAQLLEHAEEQLAEMANERVLLMASQ